MDGVKGVVSARLKKTKEKDEGKDGAGKGKPKEKNKVRCILFVKKLSSLLCLL